MTEGKAAAKTVEGAQMTTRRCPSCYVCGAPGVLLYHSLADRLFGVPGQWDLRICPDPGCKLVWLDPMPTEGEIGKAYKIYYTHQSAQASIRPLKLLQQRLFALVRSAYLAERYGHTVSRLPRLLRKITALPLYLLRAPREAADVPLCYLTQGRGRFLDVGCGDGSVVQLGRDLGWDAEGIETDPKAAANARSKNLRVHLGELVTHRFPDNSFDLILMNHVIEHVSDPRSLLRECQRVLRPGALLVVLTPNNESWGHARFGADWRGLEPPRHLHIFSARSLARVADAADFCEMSISAVVRSAPYIFRMSRSLRRMSRETTGSMVEPGGHLYGCAASVAEQIVLKANPLLGEELLLEARR